MSVGFGNAGGEKGIRDDVYGSHSGIRVMGSGVVTLVADDVEDDEYQSRVEQWGATGRCGCAIAG